MGRFGVDDVVVVVVGFVGVKYNEDGFVVAVGGLDVFGVDTSEREASGELGDSNCGDKLTLFGFGLFCSDRAASLI